MLHAQICFNCLSKKSSDGYHSRKVGNLCGFRLEDLSGSIRLTLLKRINYACVYYRFMQEMAIL